MIFFFSQIDGLFYFDKSVNHSINLKLDREHCPSSGLINFAIPVRISLQSKDGQWKEYFRAINRSMTVLPKTPTIPKDTNAPLRKLFFYIYIYIDYISLPTVMCANTLGSTSESHAMHNCRTKLFKNILALGPENKSF